MSQTARILVIRADGKQEAYMTPKNTIGQMIQQLLNVGELNHIELSDGRVLFYAKYADPTRINAPNAEVNRIIRAELGVTRVITGDVALTYGEDFLDDVPLH